MAHRENEERTQAYLLKEPTFIDGATYMYDIHISSLNKSMIMKVSFFLRKPQAGYWMSDFCTKRCVLEVKQPQNHHF